MRRLILASLVLALPSVLAACAGTPPAGTTGQNTATSAQQAPAGTDAMPERMHTNTGAYR
jgi:curli biogenesis system outer membrane secretion channel CsgG